VLYVVASGKAAVWLQRRYSQARPDPADRLPVGLEVLQYSCDLAGAVGGLVSRGCRGSWASEFGELLAPAGGILESKKESSDFVEFVVRHVILSES
jgi:hypothetical protein